MHLILKKLLLPSLMILLLASCSAIYQPNSLNIPLLGKKSEGTLIISTGSNSFEVQSAYAITDNFAIMFNYSKEKNNEDEKFTQDLGEFAVGFFNQKKTNVTEVYLGAGYGESSSLGSLLFNHIIDTTFAMSSTFYRLFIQTNLGIKGKIIETGVAVRASFLHFTEMKIDEFTEDVSIDSYFITPALFLRIGGPPFKFIAQIGYSISLRNSSDFLYEPFVMSIGMVLRIGS